VNSKLKEAAEGSLYGILGYSDEPLVSIDYKKDYRSSIVDGLSTAMVDEHMIKVVAWYDNEWGYSNRVIDLAEYMGEMGFQYKHEEHKEAVRSYCMA
jgi:glyceraldehyde 3-phosphate dehydrogenase